MVISMTSIINLISNLSSEDMAILEKEEAWVFDMTEEQFRHMTEDCELPVYRAARAGLYKAYQEVPTGEWMRAFNRSKGRDSRILFAMLHNAIWRQAKNRFYKPEYQKPVSPFKYLVHPYQGFGHLAP